MQLPFFAFVEFKDVDCATTAFQQLKDFKFRPNDKPLWIDFDRVCDFTRCFQFGTSSCTFLVRMRAQRSESRTSILMTAEIIETMIDLVMAWVEVMEWVWWTRCTLTTWCFRYPQKLRHTSITTCCIALCYNNTSKRTISRNVMTTLFLLLLLLQQSMLRNMPFGMGGMGGMSGMTGFNPMMGGYVLTNTTWATTITKYCNNTTVTTENDNDNDNNNYNS